MAAALRFDDVSDEFLGSSVVKSVVFTALLVVFYSDSPGVCCDSDLAHGPAPAAEHLLLLLVAHHGGGVHACREEEEESTASP